MLLRTGGSTRGWGESVSPHGATWKTPVPSLGCKHRYLKRFHLSPGRQGLPLPAQQKAPAGICAPWPSPGQLSHGQSHQQWTTRGRKYSQKQLAKALAQPTPCLYLLRGLDLVQILKKKNRKRFTCYLMWSSCSEQFLCPGSPVVQDRSHWGGSLAAATGVCGARLSTFPVPQGFHTAWPLPSAKYSHFCYFTCL